MIKLNRALKSFSGDFCLYDMGANLRCQEEAILCSVGRLVSCQVPKREQKGNLEQGTTSPVERLERAQKSARAARPFRFMVACFALSLKLALPGKGHARSTKTEEGKKRAKAEETRQRYVLCSSGKEACARFCGSCASGKIRKLGTGTGISRGGCHNNSSQSGHFYLVIHPTEVTEGTLENRIFVR